jgi:hypothetical protein
MTSWWAKQADELIDLLHQSEVSGARRRAVLLHTERLPPALSKPHHLRLAREALQVLVQADRGQLFELPQGRIAIVWRSRGGSELAQAQQALSHLLADQPEGLGLEVGHILTQYDLPDQAVWLLDEIAAPDTEQAIPPDSLPALDVKQLARLETSLAQADLSPFARWRAVRRLPPSWPPPKSWRLDASLAWEERLFAVHDVSAQLCPGYNIRTDAWLFRRLTRLLDARMLAMLSAPRDDRGTGAFAINLNVGTILSPDFLRFDEALKLPLRGQVILFVRAADILADHAAWSFARNFAHARAYRLGLAGASLALLRLIDVGAAGFDIVQAGLSPEFEGGPDRLRDIVPPDVTMVLTGLDRQSHLRWAAQQGFTYGRGRAFSH